MNKIHMLIRQMQEIVENENGTLKGGFTGVTVGNERAEGSFNGGSCRNSDCAGSENTKNCTNTIGHCHDSKNGTISPGDYGCFSDHQTQTATAVNTSCYNS